MAFLDSLGAFGWIVVLGGGLAIGVALSQLPLALREMWRRPWKAPRAQDGLDDAERRRLGIKVDDHNQQSVHRSEGSRDGD